MAFAFPVVNDKFADNLQSIAQDELVESLRRAVEAAESADIAKEMLRQQIFVSASALLQDVVAAATAARDITISQDFDRAVSPWHRRSSRSPLRDGEELAVEKKRRDAQNRDSPAESLCPSGTSSQTSRPPSPLEMEDQEPEDALSTDEDTVKEDESENEENESVEEEQEEGDEEEAMDGAGDAIESGRQNLYDLQGHISQLIVARYCVSPSATAKSASAYTSVHTPEIYHKYLSNQLELLHFGGSKSGLSNKQNLMT